VVQVLRTSPLAALVLLAAGCPSEEPPPITDTVLVDVYTSRCDPEAGMPEHFAEAGSVPTLRWSVLCLRDDAPVAWWAIKVSDWDDRADDWWNVWYVDPDLREVSYGETPLPGVTDENNAFSPDAFPRVAPRELGEGAYRVEVWAVTTDLVDSTIGEAKLTMLESP